MNRPIHLSAMRCEDVAELEELLHNVAPDGYSVQDLVVLMGVHAHQLRIILEEHPDTWVDGGVWHYTAPPEAA